MTFKERFLIALKLSSLENINQFCAKFDISKGNISKVINNKSDLPISLAYRIHKAFESLDIICSIEFLIGESDRLPYVKFESASDNLECEFVDQIKKEADLFKSLDNSIVLSVIDDALEPFLSVGDLVGGIKKFSDFDSNMNFLCIANYNHITGDNLTAIRYLKEGYSSNCYVLSAININSCMIEANIYNVELNWIAPISWIRKDLD